MRLHDSWTEDMMRRRGRRLARMREAAFDDRAQATLEYALTVAALMAVVVALALLWRAGETGVLARLVEDACSHVLDGMGLLDIALY